MTSVSASHPDVPTQFRAAVFPAPGAPLELVHVDYRKPGHGKLAVKVDAVVLSDLDAVSELGLLRPYAKFPRTPGTAFCGTIVETGSGAREGGSAGGLSGGPISSLVRRISRLGLGRGGSADDKDKADSGEGDVEDYHKWKVGERVIVSATHQGCAEYATAHADSACPIPHDMPLFESIVTATFGAKILVAQQQHDHHCHHLAEDDARLLVERNEREGFTGGKGAVAVYGQGGYASLAYHSLRHDIKDRVLLVSTSESHSHEDYNAPKEDFVRANLGSGLLDTFRPHGGIKHLVWVEVPRLGENGFEDLLDAMRHGGQITLLTIDRESRLLLPPAHIVARSLVIRGAPDLHSSDMLHALKMCHRFDLHRHVSVAEFPFSEQGVRLAWNRVKDAKDCWDAQIVYFGDAKQPAAGAAAATGASATVPVSSS
ncbi:hypothetical protein JCM3774_002786 [Rhodotorula dairenensis]